jgi:GST-like protein
VIDLFYYTSPNARKVLVMLEEIGLAYVVRWVDLTAGEQFAPEFLRVSPNGKVPALVDHDGPDGRPVALFESGAILVYLAEKTGRLLPAEPHARCEVLKWLFWQTSSQGPLLGQAAHFVSHAARRGIADGYAVERYRVEAERLYGVLERQLADRDYVAGEFSIADIACFPWVRVARGQGVDLAAFPNVSRWSERVAARPSAQKRLDRDQAAKDGAKTRYYEDRTWEVLFGSGRSSMPSAAGGAS